MLLEGFICVIMFAPLGMVLSSIGGLLGGWTGRHWRRARAATVSCVALLPLLIAPWENRVLYQLELRNVENVIDIHAPAEVVWRNIKRVPPIRADELPSSWSHRIGFPDPVEATLSHEGLGGIRHATFAGGVLFIETIDVWEPERRLGFSIQAQTDLIPKTTLDEHVRIGGEYFDVLHGEYRLEALANGVTRLHLLSRHRVSTDFNWYAHLWTDAVMSDLQKRILFVVQQRSEGRQLSGGGIALVQDLPRKRNRLRSAKAETRQPSHSRVKISVYDAGIAFSSPAPTEITLNDLSHLRDQ
jgi:hypothetical protein